jgi:hypothetical protein
MSRFLVLLVLGLFLGGCGQRTLGSGPASTTPTQVCPASDPYRVSREVATPGQWSLRATPALAGTLRSPSLVVVTVEATTTASFAPAHGLAHAW